MKTIFISLSSPTILRNFFLVPDGVFDKLKNSKIKIVLLAQSAACGQISKKFSGGNIFIEPIKLQWKMTIPQRIYNFFSTYLIFTGSLRLFSSLGVRNDIPAAGGRLGQLMYPLKAAVSRTLGKSLWIKKILMPKIDGLVYRSRPFKHIFEKHKPDLVFIPDVIGLQGIGILREAKRQKIKTLGMCGSWDHFAKKYEPLKVDRLLVWNEVLKKEAVELHNYNENNVFAVGVPQYDLFARKNLLMERKEFFDKFNLDMEKALIFFASEAKHSPDDGDIVEMMLNFMKENKFLSGAQIFLRPYPGVKFDHQKFDKFNGASNLYINWIELDKSFGMASHPWIPTLDRMIDFMNIIYHSDIIINTYSSISVEASAFLKPIININFDGYKKRPFNKSVKRFELLSHYKHVSETGGVRMAGNEKDLLDAINEFLSNPKSNLENTVRLRDKMCFKIDGKSSERIADHILDFLPR